MFRLFQVLNGQLLSPAAGVSQVCTGRPIVVYEEPLVSVLSKHSKCILRAIAVDQRVYVSLRSTVDGTKPGDPVWFYDLIDLNPMTFVDWSTHPIRRETTGLKAYLELPIAISGCLQKRQPRQTNGQEEGIRAGEPHVVYCCAL